MQTLALLLMLPVASLGALSGCERRDETISGYVDRTARWELVSLGGRDIDPGFLLRFPQEGQVEGASGCGPFTATQLVPYPWIEVSDQSLTATDCAAPRDHRSALAALPAMGLAEVSDDVLILSDADSAAELVFRRVTPDAEPRTVSD